MAQALEKGNMPPKLRKMFFFAQKMVIFSQNSVFDEIQFSKKKVSNQQKKPQEKSTTYPSTASPDATDPNKILLLLQASLLRFVSGRFH